MLVTVKWDVDEVRTGVVGGLLTGGMRVTGRLARCGGEVCGHGDNVSEL